MTALAALTRIEFRLQLREISSLFFPFGLPLIILVMNGMGGGNRAPVAEFGGRSPLEVYVMPLVMMMVVTIIGLAYVPNAIAQYRDIGVLRRLSVTPVHPVMILLAQGILFVAVSLLGSALAFAVGRAALGVGSPGNVFGVIAAFLLAMTAMYAIGLLVAAVVPSVRAATATGLVLFIAVMAVGGGFSSRTQFPGWLAAASEYTPVGAAHAAMSAAWTGASPDPVRLGLLAAITIACTGLAALLFRWD